MFSIFSVQTLSDDGEKIYYDGSNTNNLVNAKQDLNMLISNGASFVGYNIRNFDIPFLKKFLGIEIPSSQVLEIGEMPAVDKIRIKKGKKRLRLEEICSFVGIDAGHKKEMELASQKFRKLSDVMNKAEEAANLWHTERGWGRDFSYDYALRVLAGGMAILESFNEFVKSGGSKDSLFYKYAMGDVHVEKALYERLEKEKVF